MRFHLPSFLYGFLACALLAGVIAVACPPTGDPIPAAVVCPPSKLEIVPASAAPMVVPVPTP